MGTHFIQNKSTKAADICLSIPNLSWHSEDLGTTSFLLCHGMHEEDPLHEDVLLGTVHLQHGTPNPSYLLGATSQ